MNGILDLSIIIGLVYNWKSDEGMEDSCCELICLVAENILRRIAMLWGLMTNECKSTVIIPLELILSVPTTQQIQTLLHRLIYSLSKQLDMINGNFHSLQAHSYSFSLTKEGKKRREEKINHETRESPKSQPIWYNCLSLSDDPKEKILI